MDKIYLTFVIRKNYLKHKIRQISSKITNSWKMESHGFW